MDDPPRVADATPLNCNMFDSDATEGSRATAARPAGHAKRWLSSRVRSPGNHKAAESRACDVMQCNNNNHPQQLWLEQEPTGRISARTEPNMAVSASQRANQTKAANRLHHACAYWALRKTGTSAPEPDLALALTCCIADLTLTFDFARLETLCVLP